MRSEQNVAPEGSLTKPDARGARYQHSGFGPHVQQGHPAAIYRAWQEGHFRLLTCAELLDELKATLRKPAIAARIQPHKAGRLVNELKDLAETVSALPRVERSPDPTDDFLLALSEAGKADYLVTGDKSGLLALARHKATRIVSASEFATLLASGY